MNEDDNNRSDLKRLLGSREGPAPDDAWCVDELLKASPTERIEHVYLRRADGGALGPYLRKIFLPAADGSVGGAVRQLLMEAQRSGRSFLHLPIGPWALAPMMCLHVVPSWLQAT